MVAESGEAILDHTMEATCEGRQGDKVEGARVSDTMGLHISCTSYRLLVSEREINFYLF